MMLWERLSLYALLLMVAIAAFCISFGFTSGCVLNLMGAE